MKVEMCKWYEWDYKKSSTKCLKGHRATLKCHSIRKDCPYYQESDSNWEDYKKEMSTRSGGD